MDNIQKLAKSPDCLLSEVMQPSKSRLSETNVNNKILNFFYQHIYLFDSGVFLQEKRSLFPRFYFIGDDDLLEILGQATNPTVIQSHLKKLFAGIHSVDFDEGCDHIVAMKSLDGEVVPLRRKVQITPEVEVPGYCVLETTNAYLLHWDSWDKREFVLFLAVYFWLVLPSYMIICGCVMYVYKHTSHPILE